MDYILEINNLHKKYHNTSGEITAIGDISLKVKSTLKIKTMYEFFVRDWQDEYGPRPIEYVPGEDSEDYKAWLERNDKV